MGSQPASLAPPETRAEAGRAGVFLMSAWALAALPLLAPRALGLATSMEPATFLPLHAAGELVLVATGLATAVVQWYAAGSRGVRREARGRLLGAALLAGALLGAAHLLVFPGMPGFLGPAAAERGTWYWLVTHAVLLGGLGVAAFVPPESDHPLLRRGPLYLAALAVAAAAVAVEAAWPGAAGLLHRAGPGLGSAAADLELGAALLASGLAALHGLRFRATRDPVLLRTTSALGLTALAAACVAVEPSPYDLYELLGHLYALGASVLVFDALFAAALLDPYARLDATTRALASSNARLDALRGHVEGELAATIRRLGEANDREALARAELEAAFAAAPEGIVAYDASGRIERTNAAAERLLGYGPEQRGESLHARWARLKPQTVDGKLLALEENPIVRALRGESVPGTPVSIEDGGGRRVWLSVSAAPMRAPDARITGAIASLADIGTVQALQSQREDLLRAVSHDLRNPLQIVLLQAERLQRLLAGASRERERQAAARIAQASKHMGVIIRDLVEVARMESGRLALQLQPVPLRPLVERLLAQAAGALEVARVEVHVPEDLPPAHADPARLERVFVNLVGNALKYSPEGGEVRVTAGVSDGKVVVSVADRGPGIAPEDLPRVFERFFRGQRTHAADGLGLGLYIVQILVEAHGGKVWAESAPGAGAKISFTLPIAG